jgi:hypothetical protein
MLFGKDGGARPFRIVDWQTMSWSPAMSDISYFLGTTLKTEDRRKREGDLIDLYFSLLGPKNKLTKDEILEVIKRQSFLGLMTCIYAPMSSGNGNWPSSH